MPATQNNIFRILSEVRTGVPRISFGTDGPSISALGATGNIWIEGVPEERENHTSLTQSLDMDEVNGDRPALISGRDPEGDEIAARLGTALGSDRMATAAGTQRGRRPLPSRHPRRDRYDGTACPPDAVRQGSGIQAGTGPHQTSVGQSAGKADLGDSLLTMEPVVHVEAFDVAAAYDRVPYALAAQGDTVSYTGKSLTFGNVKASIGKSSFSGVSATFGLSGKKAFSLSDGSLVRQLLRDLPLDFRRMGEGSSSVKVLESCVLCYQVNLSNTC
ncbi:MAG: hypothetical protein MZV70_01120, partial [Desulfobacterales bacterium]|nr:hypothetical protein [Desulfobacterales bacterium]